MIRRYHAEVALETTEDDVAAVLADVAIPPGAVDAIELQGLDNGRDPLDFTRATRHEVRAAEHERPPLPIGVHLDDVTRQKGAAAKAPVRPKKNRTAGKVPARTKYID